MALFEGFDIYQALEILNCNCFSPLIVLLGTPCNICVLLKVIFDNHVQLEIHKIYGYPRLYWHQDANGSSFPLFAFSSLISEADIRKETLVALLFTRFIGTIVSPIVAQKFFENKLCHKDNFIKHCILLLPYRPVKSAKYLSTH